MKTLESADSQNTLTKFPLASFREFASLSIPLIFSCLSASLLGFCDRLFLSHHSLEAWNAASTSGYIAYFYQMFCMSIAMIAQSFIGQYLGARQLEKVGPAVWQMIWFAFLSMLITYPSSFLTEYYFKGTEIETSALAYFRPLVLCNFLYPLNAALTTFFLGTGKARIILFANFSIQLLNVLLDYFLIFGAGSLIPPLGTFGAALATIISEATLCIILFIVYSRSQYTSRFQTNIRKLNPQLFKEMLKVGIPRAVGRGMAVAAWSFAAHLLVERGGNHLLVLTLGTSLFTACVFINDGIGQALVTIASHILGARKEKAINQLILSSASFLAFAMIFLAIPLLFMREFTISLFITDPLTESTLQLLKNTCTMIWFICLANGVHLIGVSFITASRDTFFYACLISANWITICIPAYLFIGYFNRSPENFFLIDGANTLLFGIIYLIRFRKGFWKKRFLTAQQPLKA